MSDSGEPQQQEEEQQQQQVCNFFKKPSKSKNIRKCPAVEEDNVDEDSKDERSVIYNKKKPAVTDSKLYFSTGSSKHQLESKREEVSKSPLFQFESSKEIHVHNDSRATTTLKTETEFSKDARAIWEKTLKQAEESLKGTGSSTNDEKLYKSTNPSLLNSRLILTLDLCFNPLL